MPKRKENRTKGNTRPASSSRMADKLAGAGEFRKFVGFDSLSGDGDAAADHSDVDHLVYTSDAHFVTVLKQLGKRDTTTKLKALVEFSGCCESQPVGELKCGLSIWPLMFNKLCTDNDHRVREATHKAMATFLAKVRKDFQPHLRTVMGAWTAGMNDSHSSASAAAIAAFSETFSVDRQQQVFQFTFKEIVQYMDDLVLVQTADTYTDPKSYTADERTKRYEMAVAMAILGVRYALDQLSEAYISEKGGDFVDQVIRKPAFLKLMKNGNPVIRAAFLKLMATYLHKHNTDISQPGKQLCQAVFSGLRETDPSTVVCAWQAMLVIMNKLENWSQHVNLQKAVLPDLWVFLSSGNGYAVAKQVYPLLPAFLKALSKVHASPRSLYISFLDKLITGVTKDLSRTSYGGEFEAIMESYVQCYTFVFSTTLSDQTESCGSDDNLFIQQLIDKISDVIKMCLTVGRISRSTFHTVMHAMCTLVNQLLCNHGDVINVRAHLRNTILTEVSVIMNDNDYAKDTHFTRVSDTLVLFRHCQDTTPIVHLCTQATADDSNKKVLFEFLQPIVIRVCTVCLNVLTDLSSLLHAKLLSLTLQHYATRELLLTLGAEVKHSGESDDSLANLLEYILLIIVRFQSEGEEIMENLVEVMLLVTQECPTHLDEILTDNVEANKVIEKLVALILLKGAKMKLDVKNLSTVNCSIDKIVSSIENNSCNQVPFMWQLLEVVLTKPDEQVLSLQHSTAILRSLCGRVIAVCNEDSAFGQEDLHYCKIICKTDAVFFKNVIDDIHKVLFHLLIHLCDESEDPTALSNELIGCYQNTSSKFDLKSYFDWLFSKLLDHFIMTGAPLSRCLAVGKVLCRLHPNADPGVILSCASYSHQVDVLPTIVADRMCYGKLLIEPQSYPIGSFENKPTNDAFPSSLYGSILVAVLCSSDKDEAETQIELHQDTIDFENKVSSEDTTNALISLGLAFLFLESSTIDFEKQIRKMIQSTARLLLGRASTEESLREVLDAIVTRCSNDYVLIESMSFLFHSLDTLTAEESAVIVGTLTTHVSCTQLCTRFNGACIAEQLREKVTAIRYNQHGDVIEALAVSLLLAQSTDPDWEFPIEIVKLLMDQQQLVEYDSFDDASHRNVSFLSLEVFTTLVMAGRVTSECWDFILCSAVTIMQLFDDKIQITAPISILHCSMLRLCLQLDLYFVDSTQQNLVTEWRDFFSPAITNAVVLQFKYILKHRKSFDGHFVKVEEYLCCKLLNRLCKEPAGHFSISELVEHLCSGSYPVQITAHHLLTKMLKITIFGQKDESQNRDEWVTMLKSTVMECQKKLSDDHSLSISGGNTVAYMLIWLLCIVFLRDTDHTSETRMQLLEWIKESGAAEALVCELITHIPVQSFTNNDHIEVTLTADITNLSMITFKAVAQQLPVVLRQWFITLDRKAGSLVEGFTKRYITPLLWKDQLATFEASPRSFDNMEVKLGRDTPEVMIKYRIDDTARIELVMLLSDAHPLYLPTITQERGVKVNIGNWKKWILQLNSYIGNQNGTLLQGLAIWKANLDKHFAGIEDCMICFSVIHHSNQSLPRLTCKTCKKKFHNICLYKWFNTSTKSTCPLCRNIF